MGTPKGTQYIFSSASDSQTSSSALELVHLINVLPSSHEGVLSFAHGTRKIVAHTKGSVDV